MTTSPAKATQATSGPRMDAIDHASMPSTASTTAASSNPSQGRSDCLKLRLNDSKNWRATYVSSWRTIRHSTLCMAVNAAPAVTIGMQHSSVSTLRMIRSNSTPMMAKNMLF